MGLVIIDDFGLDGDECPIFKSQSILDDMKLEYVAKVLSKYSLPEIETLLPETRHEPGRP